MILVEEMDRTLKACSRRRWEILGKLDIMFRNREPNPPEIGAALGIGPGHRAVS